MRRRRLRWVLALAGLGVVIVAGAVVLWPHPPSRITRENFDRIKVGMSRPEVEAILGPPGDYRMGPTLYFLDVISPKGSLPFLIHNPADRWESEIGAIDVFFGPTGVTASVYAHGVKVGRSAFDDLLWRLKRQWHRWFPEK
jgi:hypothetical protein